MFSGDIERDHWHELVYANCINKIIISSSCFQTLVFLKRQKGDKCLQPRKNELLKSFKKKILKSLEAVVLSCSADKIFWKFLKTPRKAELKLAAFTAKNTVI